MSRPINWGLGGCSFVVFALVNFGVFLATGAGIGSRMGHQVKGWWAVLGSLVFLFLGLLALLIALVKRITGPGSKRFRR
jgi:hypothetical protein